jgi:lysophospholipid acyltransferase (LPLAT)-like uncharacterized protein
MIERSVARLAVVAARGLFATLSHKSYFADSSLSPYRPISQASCIFSVWHDSLLIPLFLGRQPATKALVSRHQDGGFLSTALTALGISSVRGSSSSGGAEAVRKLIEETEACHIVVTPDGPRGPRRVMKEGVAFLASRTGKLVVPTAFACTRSWFWGAGWTDLMVPKPGSTVVAIAGRGIAVPADADRDDLAGYITEIQHQMNRLNALVADVAAAIRAGTALPDDIHEFTAADAAWSRTPSGSPRAASAALCAISVACQS